MTDPYTYAALIVNNTEESRFISLIMDIMETDLISDQTLNMNRERIVGLRKLGEHKLADSIEKNYSILF